MGSCAEETAPVLKAGGEKSFSAAECTRECRSPDACRRISGVDPTVCRAISYCHRGERATSTRRLRQLFGKAKDFVAVPPLPAETADHSRHAS